MAEPRQAKPSKSKRSRPASSIASEEALKDLALAYALRFPGTTERLKKHLHKKVGEAIDAGRAPLTARRWIDPVIATLTRVKVLDDALYAEHRARTLHRRGRSTRLIARDLELKAAPKAAIGSALDTLADDGDTDFKAAVLLAKKKRLGPFGSGLVSQDRDARVKLRMKQLGTLARAGFSFEIARKVVDAPSRESLDET